jgi:hypothetical protein
VGTTALTKRIANGTKTELDEELADDLKKNLPDERENQFDDTLDDPTPVPNDEEA